MLDFVELEPDGNFNFIFMPDDADAEGPGQGLRQRWLQRSVGVSPELERTTHEFLCRHDALLARCRTTVGAVSWSVPAPATRIC